MRPVYSHVRQTPTQGTHSAPLGAFFAPTCATPAKLAVLPACNRARCCGQVRQGGTPRGAAPWQSLSRLRAAWPAQRVCGCRGVGCFHALSPQCVARSSNHRCGSISRRCAGRPIKGGSRNKQGSGTNNQPPIACNNAHCQSTQVIDLKEKSEFLCGANFLELVAINRNLKPCL